jgi:hypothetical protein
MSEQKDESFLRLTRLAFGTCHSHGSYPQTQVKARAKSCPNDKRDVLFVTTEYFKLIV